MVGLIAKLKRMSHDENEDHRGSKEFAGRGIVRSSLLRSTALVGEETHGGGSGGSKCEDVVSDARSCVGDNAAGNQEANGRAWASEEISDYTVEAHHDCAAPRFTSR